MKKCLLIVLALLLLAVSGLAQAGDYASPTFRFSFEYPAIDGLIGFTVQVDGSDRCTILRPTVRTITCTTMIENKPTSTFSLIAQGNYGRRSQPFAVVEYAPPPEMFEDLPSPKSNLIIELVNELNEIGP